MAILEVKNIHKSFGRTEVLKDVSFSLEKGEILLDLWKNSLHNRCYAIYKMGQYTL